MIKGRAMNKVPVQNERLQIMYSVRGVLYEQIDHTDLSSLS